jgi:hypothetical protein
VGGTNHDEASKALLFAHLSSLQLLSASSQVVVRSSKIVIATEVSEGLERFFVDLDDFFFHESLETIDKTVKLDVFPGSLESQQTINNVVTTRGLLAKEYDCNLLLFALIRDERLEFFVELTESWVVILGLILDNHQLVLNLHKVGGLRVFLDVWKLLINLRLHKLSEGLILLDTHKGVAVVL